MNKNKSKSNFIEKELSWISFNERVLQEAENPDVPEVQRLRYLGIFSNNLDEFFRVRVADVSRLAAFSASKEEKEHYNELLETIQQRIITLRERFDEAYFGVLSALQKRKIYIVNESQIDEHQSKTVENIFTTQVLPELDPILIESTKRFPEIRDGISYLAIKIVSNSDNIRYALLDVPTDKISRFIQIPSPKGKRGKVFIMLENIIRFGLLRVFRGLIDIKHLEAYTIKLTRDAELELSPRIDQTLIVKMVKSLANRRKGDPERFVYDRDMPDDLLLTLRQGLKLSKYDSLMPGGRYHNSKDFISFPKVGPAYLEFKTLSPIPLLEFSHTNENIFNSLREKDLLLHYPYHSFDTVLDLLKTAAIDPAVKSIKICLYRVAKNSRIIDTLLSAKKNNKIVKAVVELQARFDEEANIDWARQLTEGGVDVVFGVVGLKIHSKLIVIERQEGSKTRLYSHIGTGNLNEKTAGIYTDFSLLTYNQDLGADVDKVFDFIACSYKRQRYQHLLVSPHTNRFGLTKLIRKEISNAIAGLPAEIIIKCNNLVDDQIIDYLYKASSAGVRIKVICRGMMSLVPGIKGVSENIEAISIIDRYLEHPRVYIFHNAGNPQYFISSADLMTRNLDCRVEVTAPIFDPSLKQQIQGIIDLQWCDNVKSRVLDKKQSNKYRKLKINGKIRSQEAIYNYLKDGILPLSVRQKRKKNDKDLILMAQKRLKKINKNFIETDAS